MFLSPKTASHAIKEKISLKYMSRAFQNYLQIFCSPNTLLVIIKQKWSKNFDKKFNLGLLTDIYIYRERERYINRKFGVNGFEFYEVL